MLTLRKKETILQWSDCKIFQLVIPTPKKRICKITSSTQNMKIVTKNESSVTDDIPRSISSSRDEILLVSEKFYLL
jgi:hypothetical protein